MLLSDRKAARKEALEMGLFPRRILLATNGSEEAELADLKAVDLAQRTDSGLHVAHVGVVPSFLRSVLVLLVQVPTVEHHLCVGLDQENCRPLKARPS